ncbi:MAG TPA: glycoside hydrolase family 88 protein [Bryobacteraceae bacterium]
MLSRDLLREVAVRAADRLLFYPWKMWFWGDSIGLEGLLDAGAITGDGKYITYVYGLLKAWIAREGARSEFDYTAPGVALLRVYEQTGDTVLLDTARRHASYLTDFRRTSHGAYVRYENAAFELPPELASDHPQHVPAQAAARSASDGGPCVFVDSVHFDGPFFAKLYAVTREERYRELALANICPQIDLLYDPAERLFHHFWIERTGQPNGIYWARGNGWGLLGIAATLEGVGGAGSHATRLRTVLKSGIERIAELQDPSGAWHTILTDRDSYIETSTAAFFVDVVCRAGRLGLISLDSYRSLLKTAMRFLLRHVCPDGALDGVSYETFPSTRAEHYRRMPRGAVVPWGQGPLLAAIRSYLEVSDDAGLQLGATEEHPHATR